MAKQLIKCTAKTCIYYKKGICMAEILDIINLEFENDGKHQDEQICNTYKHNPDWIDGEVEE